MSKKEPKTPQISVRGPTYDRLRDYCRKHGVQIRTIIDDVINRALDAETKRS